jgi:hypothetical protein
MGGFAVFASEVLIGHSDLETGDPPMGVASGRFWPLPAFDGIRSKCIAAREGCQDHLALSIRLPNGLPLPAEHGVSILDYSSELGPDGLEVHAVGIAYPLYEALFPEHVAAYAKQLG